MHPEIARPTYWREPQLRTRSSTRHHRSTRRFFPRRPAATEDR